MFDMHALRRGRKPVGKTLKFNAKGPEFKSLDY